MYFAMIPTCNHSHFYLISPTDTTSVDLRFIESVFSSFSFLVVSYEWLFYHTQSDGAQVFICNQIWRIPTRHKPTCRIWETKKDFVTWPTHTFFNTTMSTVSSIAEPDILLSQWLDTDDFIAKCFICDIRVMKRKAGKFHCDPFRLPSDIFTGEQIWWLKRIPCKRVTIVGMIVGIQYYERRISYLSKLLLPYAFGQHWFGSGISWWWDFGYRMYSQTYSGCS